MDYTRFCVKEAVLSEGKFAISFDLIKICSSGGIVACNPGISDEIPEQENC